MIEFKLRASCGGKLATNPKAKTEVLSQTTKTYLDEVIKEHVYGIRKEITSKYLDKGISKEDEAIDKAIEWLDLPFALKNKERFADEYFTGEPDLILDDEVIDIKNSWDCFTFPLLADSLPTDDYFFQVQIYMHLTGKRKARVVYVLLNTPETYNTTEIDYSHIDQKYRIKSFTIEYDEAIIEFLKQRVIDSRIYIKSKLEKL